MLMIHPVDLKPELTDLLFFTDPPDFFHCLFIKFQKTSGIDYLKTVIYAIYLRKRMAQNNKAVQTPKATPAGSFSMRMGSTTYIIGVHFSAESKDTLEDKMKRLMRDDVKADNF